LREKLGGSGVSDDELLLRYFAGNEDVEALRAAGPSRDYPSVRQPLLGFIEKLMERKDCHQIYIRKGDLSLRLERQHL
jgi:oxaloacetate decarboxylase alpha subunit